MFSTDDTIVAIATPIGRGGIGVVRVSGADASRIAQQLVDRDLPFEPRHVTLARLADRPESSSDQVLVTIFPAPHSYTGEDVAEISAHGSPIVLDGILRRAISAGARLAEPGEFTLRGFLHGKLDLIQAEAVADLVDAVTPLQARAAFDQLEGTLTGTIAAIERDLFDLMARLEASLDFPDEGYHFVRRDETLLALTALAARIEALLAGSARGRLVREGAQVAIVGAPNVGKSSLFNALLNANRAIVTAVPGTTRDLVTERADIKGMSIALIDTAGIRDTGDEVEREGVARARRVVEVADLLIVVLDRSRPPSREDDAILAATASRPRVVVLNKSDLPARAENIKGAALEVSTKTSVGLDALAEQMVASLGSGDDARDQPRVTNIRHIALLEHTRDALSRARAALQQTGHALPEEFILADLQEAAEHLQEITGKRTTDDLLRHIFERFCIGK
jgi:tRNA modification GTPase